MKQKILILSFVLFAALFISIPAVSRATLSVCGGNEIASPTVNLDTYSSTCHLSDIFKLIARVTNVLIDLAGVYAVIMFVYRGAKIVVLSPTPESAAKEKQGLWNAVWGFLIVMISFVVVNFIFFQLLGASFVFPLITNPFK